jgi:hypothetical protein
MSLRAALTNLASACRSSIKGALGIDLQAKSTGRGISRGAASDDARTINVHSKISVDSRQWGALCVWEEDPSARAAILSKLATGAHDRDELALIVANQVEYESFMPDATVIDLGRDDSLVLDQANADDRQFSIKEWLLDDDPWFRRLIVRTKGGVGHESNAWVNDTLIAIKNLVRSPELHEQSQTRCWLIIDDLVETSSTLESQRDLLELLSLCRAKGIRIAMGVSTEGRLFDSYFQQCIPLIQDYGVPDELDDDQKVQQPSPARPTNQFVSALISFARFHVIGSHSTPTSIANICNGAPRSGGRPDIGSSLRACDRLAGPPGRLEPTMATWMDRSSEGPRNSKLLSWRLPSIDETADRAAASPARRAAKDSCGRRALRAFRLGRYGAFGDLLPGLDVNARHVSGATVLDWAVERRLAPWIATLIPLASVETLRSARAKAGPAELAIFHAFDEQGELGRELDEARDVSDTTESEDGSDSQDGSRSASLAPRSRARSL